MRRPLAAVLLLAATLGAAPARAASTTQIVLVLRYDTTCATATSCQTTVSGVSCLEHAFGDPCAVEPVTIPLATPPQVPGGACTLALYASTFSPPELVVHTASAGDLRLRVQAFAAHGSVAALVATESGFTQATLVAAGGAGGTVTEVATRTCPDVSDGRLAGVLVVTAV